MRETESFTWVGGRPGRAMRILRRIVPWIVVLAGASLLRAVPGIVREVQELAEQIDRSTRQDFHVCLVLAAACVLLLVLGIAHEAWGDWRHGRWTRLELGPDGVTAWRGSTRRRLGWGGLRAVLHSEHGANLSCNGLQVRLRSGWQSDSRMPSDGEKDETEAWLDVEAFGHPLGLRRFEHDPVARALARRGISVEPLSRWHRWFGGPLFALVPIPMFAMVFLAATLPQRLMRWELPESQRDAVSQGRRDVERWPDSSMAHAYLATSLLESGQPTEALTVANAGFDLGEPQFILGVRARALEELGRHRDAARDAAGLLPWGRLHDTARVTDLLIRAGDLRGARRWAGKEVARKDVPSRRDALARVAAAEAAAAP